MTRRSIIRVLLSLLLLMSQQMAISHAITHWTGSLGRTSQQFKAAAADKESAVSRAFAQDQTCQQCLAFAQIASAVGSPARCFAASQAASCAPVQALGQPVCARTVCAFQSRAPPSFA